MMATTSNTFKSDTLYLKDIRAFIRQQCNDSAFEKNTTDRITLAVDEACTNIIRHAYEGKPDKDIIITIESTPHELVIYIQDFGIKPDLGKIHHHPPEQMRRGGYGVICIHQIMDNVSYDLSQKHGTILKLTKFKKT